MEFWEAAQVRLAHSENTPCHLEHSERSFRKDFSVSLEMTARVLRTGGEESFRQYIKGVVAMKLYTFFRSSASYRVRIALNLKGLTYERAPIHLRRGGGEQLAAAYKAINPQALVPALEDNGKILTQSLAIIEYLEEKHQKRALLPADPADKALVRSMAMVIACEVHPIQNLRVLNHVKKEYGQTDEQVNRWAQHW